MVQFIKAIKNCIELMHQIKIKHASSVSFAFSEKKTSKKNVLIQNGKQYVKQCVFIIKKLDGAVTLV